MPIYEYESVDPEKGCSKCFKPFEVFQTHSEDPLSVCPNCGRKVRKVISFCRAAVVETSPEHTQTENKIRDYERQEMWSHAAELADKYSEKTQDKGMKMRALDNYKKAGYNSDTLAKHAD